MKKLLTVLFVAMLSFALFAAAATETPSAGVSTLKLGTQAPPSTPLYAWAEAYAEALNEVSGGKLTVEVVGSSALGTTAQHYAQLGTGNLDIFLTGFDSAAIMKEGKDFNIFVIPYAFDDVNHFVRFVDSQAFTDMCTPVEKANNVHFMGLLTIGNPRGLSTTKTDVKSVADVKNLKIRVPDSKAQIEVWMAWGANPVVISAADLYTAMESGICDGQENPLDGTVMSGYLEVQHYYTELDYIQQGTVLWMSQKTYDSLTAEQKTWTEQARAKVYEKLSADTLASLSAMRQKAIDSGMVVHTDDFDRQSFVDIAEQMVATFEGDLFSAGLWAKVRALSQK